MASRQQSQIDIEAQEIMVPTVDKPSGTYGVITIIALMVLAALSTLWILSYFSGGGSGITSLCNSYLVGQGNKISKLDATLMKAWGYGYSNTKHVEKVTKPFLTMLIKHFMNNVNAFGPVTEVEMTFDLKDGIFDNPKNQSMSASSAKGFLESLMGYSLDIPAGFGQYHWEKLGLLIELLRTLGGGGMMDMMKQIPKPGEDGKPQKVKDPFAKQKGEFASLEDFEKRQRLKDVTDPDFYIGIFGNQMLPNKQRAVDLIEASLESVFTGSGPATALHPQAAQVLQALVMKGDPKGTPPTPDGLLVSAQKRYMDTVESIKKKGGARSVPALCWIVPESVELKVTRGIFSSKTDTIWKSGPIQPGESQSTKSELA